MLGMRLIAVILVGLCTRSSPEVVSLVKDADATRKIDLDSAIVKYERARQLDPGNHRISWKLGAAHVAKENWEKASDVLAVACSEAPTYATYFFMHGFVLERLGRWADAKTALEKSIALDAGYADPEFDLGQVLLRSGDEQGALAHFSKAIELQPDNAVFWATLADLYVRLGYLEHAQKTLDASEPFVKADDKHRFELHSLGGQILLEKKDLPGAIARFEQAKLACGSCTEKGQPIAYFNLGAAYAAAKRKTEALAELTRFNKIVCKGAAAQRYANECMQAQQLARALSP